MITYHDQEACEASFPKYVSICCKKDIVGFDTWHGFNVENMYSSEIHFGW